MGLRHWAAPSLCAAFICVAGCGDTQNSATPQAGNQTGTDTPNQTEFIDPQFGDQATGQDNSQHNGLSGLPYQDLWLDDGLGSLDRGFSDGFSRGLTDPLLSDPVVTDPFNTDLPGSNNDQRFGGDNWGYNGFGNGLIGGFESPVSSYQVELAQSLAHIRNINPAVYDELKALQDKPGLGNLYQIHKGILKYDDQLTDRPQLLEMIRASVTVQMHENIRDLGDGLVYTILELNKMGAHEQAGAFLENIETPLAEIDGFARVTQEAMDKGDLNALSVLLDVYDREIGKHEALMEKGREYQQMLKDNPELENPDNWAPEQKRPEFQLMA